MDCWAKRLVRLRAVIVAVVALVTAIIVVTVVRARILVIVGTVITIV